MKISKEPSIFDDRSGLGSSDELDEYGVWVKSEPQDLEITGSSHGSSAAFDTFSMKEEIVEESVDDEFLTKNTDFDGFEDTEEPEKRDINEDEANFDGLIDGLSFDDTVEDSVSVENSEKPEITGNDSSSEHPVSDSDIVLSESEDDFNFDLGIEDNETEHENISGDDFKFVTTDDGGSPENDAMGETEVQESVLRQNTVPKIEEAGVATELLLKIATEISSIKSDLESLKSEISSIRNDVPAASSDPGVEKHDTEADSDVALTGDELDDVLSSADITHENTTVVSSDSKDSVESVSFDDPSDTVISNANLSDDITVDESVTEDESISLTDDELNNLQIDKNFSLDEGDIEISTDNAEKTDTTSDEALTGNELDNIINTSDMIEETGIDADFSADPELDKLAGEGFETDGGDVQEAAFDIELVNEDTGKTVEDDMSVFDNFDDSETENKTQELEVPALPPDGTPDESFDVENFDNESGSGLDKDPDSVRADISTAPAMPEKFKNEIRTVLAYMDQLLESLPEEKIEEFARSDKFDIYKKVFKDLGLV